MNTMIVSNIFGSNVIPTIEHFSFLESFHANNRDTKRVTKRKTTYINAESVQRLNLPKQILERVQTNLFLSKEKEK